jgi:hypothetical protein
MVFTGLEFMDAMVPVMNHWYWVGSKAIGMSFQR